MPYTQAQFATERNTSPLVSEGSIVMNNDLVQLSNVVTVTHGFVLSRTDWKTGEELKNQGCVAVCTPM